MSKEKVIEYVMNSPHNTNRAVLEGLLDGISGSEYTLLFEEEVTTTMEDEDTPFPMGNFSYNEYINADTVKVTFDGVEYQCDLITAGEYSYYGGINNISGGPDFSEYPFLIVSTSGAGTMIATQTSGTYTVKVEVPQSSSSSSDWSTAEVTFINHTTISGTVQCVGIDMSQNYLCVDDVTITNANEKMNPPYSTTIYLIPLYKNQYRLSSSDFSEDFSDISITTTGNITEDEGGYLITGDCTITFNTSLPITPTQ